MLGPGSLTTFLTGPAAGELSNLAERPDAGRAEEGWGWGWGDGDGAGVMGPSLVAQGLRLPLLVGSLLVDLRSLRCPL